MVLGRTLVDAQGVPHAMAGLLPVETSYAKRKLHLGYRIAILRQRGVLGRRGSQLVGHEFHYASIIMAEPQPALADVTDAEGNPLGPAGHQVGQVSGTFFHLVAPR